MTLLLLYACAGAPCQGYVDADGDGFGGPTVRGACGARAGLVATGGDCNDARASVYPGAVERCDGVDDDCDGRADLEAVDARTWYVDGDADGFGDLSFAVVACEPPDGFVSEGGDCSDNDATVRPGADEVCDGLDQDCDGAIDEDALDALLWYADVDGDGWAEAEASSAGCTAPEGYIDGAALGDCDDENAGVNPQASETCDDGEDANCDGFERPCALDEPLVVGGGLGELWLGAMYASRAGQAVAWADTDGDGRDEALIGAPRDSSYVTHGGVVFVQAGWGEDPYTLAGATAIFSATEAYANLGADLAGVEDVDGDGYGDILVGAKGASGLEPGAGAAYLFCGPATSVGTEGAEATIVGGQLGDEAANSVAGLGDLDADGFADIAVTAPGLYGGSGAVHVFFGPVTGVQSLDQAGTILIGEGYERVARVASGGDVDGDGVGDVLAGATLADDGAGAAYLFTTVERGELSTSGATVRLVGSEEGVRIGDVLSIVGDVDGDGYADLLLGGPGERTGSGGAGAVWLVRGPRPEGLDTAVATLYGDALADGAGAAVSSAGDVDGDGRVDILVGAPGQDEAGLLGGAVYLLLGPLSGTATLGEASHARLLPPQEGTESGASVAGGGDLDGDGRSEVLWGAPDYLWYGGALVLPGTAL